MYLGLDASESLILSGQDLGLCPRPQNPEYSDDLSKRSLCTWLPSFFDNPVERDRTVGCGQDHPHHILRGNAFARCVNDQESDMNSHCLNSARLLRHRKHRTLTSQRLNTARLICGCRCVKDTPWTIVDRLARYGPEPHTRCFNSRHSTCRNLLSSKESSHVFANLGSYADGPCASTANTSSLKRQSA
eukprot:CAMPEP_0117525606 /NCGR_PEP_ID=MMETSP0784-20121206/35857_1 /TAXON_ID=39447 /ORGANISM="" /LENGTH=187 /DNA_ID=CAMNT_0005321809 /DNA_START=360 /DNA_END=924 /DNA_ORIENTATION=+